MKKIILILILITLVFILAESPGKVTAGELDINNFMRGKDTTDFLYNMFKKGIDFYAAGNEPSWSVNLAVNQFLRFNTLSGTEINLGSVKGEKAMDANIIRYASKSESGFFSMTISGQKCVDNMSGEEFDYKVIIEINNPGEADYRKYEGCGRYVPDYRLNRTWILKKLGDSVVSESDYMKSLPELSFDIEAGRFSGSGGCNRITGKVISAYNIIKFENPASTMMFCPGMEKEKSFLDALSRTTQYQIVRNELYLTNPDNILMVFQDTVSELKERNVLSEDSLREYRLHDIWVLDSLYGVKAGTENFGKTLPQIEVNIAELKITGTGGCNRIFGNFKISGSMIKIGPMSSTRMYCEGVNESEFLTGLQEADSWKIENNRLYLLKEGIPVVILKKVD
ncbi:MAG: META domain-containing protein [Ignavibacteria bacterium]|nr:META domain-containing protein [Ignavibacteria bacterium]